MLRRAAQPNGATPQPGPRTTLARAASRVVEVALWLAALGALVPLLWRTIGRLLAGESDALGIDPQRYLDIARRLLSGELPYVEFGFEYPPLALLAIVAPLLGSPTSLDADGYAALLVAQNVLLVVATGLCLAWLARRGWSANRPLATVTMFGLLTVATPVLFWRFDALPALLTVLALVATAAARPVLTGVALGVGAAVKLYPLVLLPIEAWRALVDGQRAAAARVVLGATVVVGATVLALMLAAGPAGLAFLGYQTERGIQIESLAGSVVLLADMLGLAPATVTIAFRSYQVDSTLAPALSALALVVTVVLAAGFGASLLATYLRDRRLLGLVSPSTHVVHVAAAILLLLVAYRVLSPQFLAWLLPFAALLPRPKVLLVLVVCVLSLYVYPVAYHELINLSGAPIAALAVRNALLVLLFVWLTLPGVATALRAGRQRAFGSR